MKFYTFIFYSLGLVSLSLSQTEICSDDDTVISIGLSIWTDVSTCSEAYTYLQTQNLNCFSDLNLPFVSAEPITFAEICCETCQEQIVYGCTDLEACNFNQNATDDDGSCDYGLECLLSPCSSSEDPGIDGAYCIDDYCNGCCAIWYNSDGTIISNSCDENSNSIIGLWYDFDADQYIEITENEIVFYTYLDDPNFNCWYYWSMDYTNLGISPITGLEMIEFIDEEDGPIQLSVNILDNGNLQLGDDAGDGIQLSPIDELPDLEM